MNFIADYYDVAALAELSSARVQEILASKWSAEQFCDLLQQSLDSTHDKGFLRMLGAEAANHIDELFEMNVFEEGSLGEGLAFYALPQCILRLREAESSVLSEKQACEREKNQSARFSQHVNKCVQLLKDNSECRRSGCEAQFTCYLELDYKSPSYLPAYTLRCASCRCRHL